MADVPWKTVESHVVHRSPWLTLYEDDVIGPDSFPRKYTYVESPPFVLVVAYDGKRFIMVRQYRYPLRRFMLEFPGGGLKEGEEALDAAKREFTEDTGQPTKVALSSKQTDVLGLAISLNETI